MMLRDVSTATPSSVADVPANEGAVDSTADLSRDVSVHFTDDIPSLQKLSRSFTDTRVPSVPPPLQRSSSAPSPVVGSLEGRIQEGLQPLTDQALQRIVSGRPSKPHIKFEHVEISKCTWGQEQLTIGSWNPGSCQICFEETDILARPCGTDACIGTYCGDCLRHTALGMIDASLYACPYLKCPSCRNRVPSKMWKLLVSESAWEKYEANARAILNFRCPECDDVGTLLPEPKVEGAASSSIPVKTAELDAWRLWDREEGPSHIIDAITAAMKGVDASSQNKDDDNDEHKRLQAPVAANHRFYSLVSDVEDPERRCTLCLEWMRRHPFFLSPCCDAKMCFKCKTSGWHKGRGCEERMRKRMGTVGVQWCPKCGVPTVKSEGCDHIVCCCGASWTWMRSSLMYSAIHDMPDALLEALAMLPSAVEKEVANEEDRKNLIDNIDDDSWEILVEFLGLPAGTLLLRGSETSARGIVAPAKLNEKDLPLKLLFQPPQERNPEDEGNSDEEEDDERNVDNFSAPLTYACLAGSAACVKILLQRGFDPNHVPVQFNYPPLISMTNENSVAWGVPQKPSGMSLIECAKLLIEASGDINCCSYVDSALSFALQEVDCPIDYTAWLIENTDLLKLSKIHLCPIQALMRRSFNLMDDEGEEDVANKDARLKEFEDQRLDLLDKLVVKKCDVNSLRNNDTPIMLACESGLVDVVKKLIKSGASVNGPPSASDKEDKNGGDKSAKSTEEDEEGEDEVKRKEEDDDSEYSCEESDSDDGGCGSDSRDYRLSTLYLAMRAHSSYRNLEENKATKVELINLLLENNADASQLGLLKCAIVNSHVPERCVELLIDNHADVNGMNESLPPPIFCAISNGHSAITRILMEKKADLTVTHESFGNVFHVLARVARQPNMVDPISWKELPSEVLALVNNRRRMLPTSCRSQLKKKRAKCSKNRDAGPGKECPRTPLALAIEANIIDTVEFLVDVKADVNLPLYEEGEFAAILPLHYVLTSTHKICMLEFLLHNGADPYNKDLLLTPDGKNTSFFAKAYDALVPLLSAAERTAAFEHLLGLQNRDLGIIQMFETLLKHDVTLAEDAVVRIAEVKGSPKIDSAFLALLNMIIERHPPKLAEMLPRCTKAVICSLRIECARMLLTRDDTFYPTIVLDIVKANKNFDSKAKYNFSENDIIELIHMAAKKNVDFFLRDDDGKMAHIYAAEAAQWNLVEVLTDNQTTQFHLVASSVVQAENAVQAARIRWEQTHSDWHAHLKKAQDYLRIHEYEVRNRAYEFRSNMSSDPHMILLTVSSVIVNNAPFYGWCYQEMPSVAANIVSLELKKGTTFIKQFLDVHWSVLRGQTEWHHLRSLLSHDLTNVSLEVVTFIREFRLRCPPETWGSLFHKNLDTHPFKHSKLLSLLGSMVGLIIAVLDTVEWVAFMAAEKNLAQKQTSARKYTREQTSKCVKHESN
eukprot:GEMP01001095.1.p1 GENE.GEMP01001095.1~~GEMP01001095.1.p1  ORF type:complete len:1450 (+),score=284.27 GEMP01001095.1:132-4481(+)